MLPYHSYYETLAELGDATNIEWQSTIAGLVVLRLVNDWLDFADVRQQTENASFAAARELIANLPATKAIHPRLQQVMRAMEVVEEASFQAVEQPLMRYTETLSQEGRFSLAHDALLPLSKRAKNTHDTPALIKITTELALTSRLTGQGEQAEEYYRSVLSYAQSIGDYRAKWRALVGLNKLAFERGDLTNIDASIANLEKIANDADDVELQCLVIHERAHIAHTIRDVSEAVRLLETITPMAAAIPHTRFEAIEGDLAASLGEVGRTIESKYKNLLLAQSAQSQIIRWTALHNLMYLTTLENDRSSFEFYRQALEFAPLPTRSAILYRHYAAKGLRQFGQEDKASQESAKAIALANQHGIMRWRLD